MILSILGQVIRFIGSLCLLLFGMNMLSDGIQKGAGSNLRKLLGKITGNRIKAVLTGIGVTAIIQSSGATTVMVVSFVNAEIMTLTQAIGVIFGANIGTTATAWIVSLFGFSFSISALAIPLFGFGYILKHFKKFKIHNFADCFMGFAVLFMGLDLLKNTLTLDANSASYILKLNELGLMGILLGVFIGAFITALIHSSSAMTAIVLTMAANGSLSWELSAAIILGSNIGSTVDAVMSSMGASTNAKRTALVHVGFNVIGTVVALVFFNPFLTFVDSLIPGVPESDITTHIAMLHTVFNLCASVVFLPFVNQIASIAKKIIRTSEQEEELHYKLPMILPYAHFSADLYSFQIQKEISKMSAKVMEMMDSLFNSITKKGLMEEESKKVNFLENYIDEMSESITHFLQKCSRLPSANSSDRNYFARLIHITDSIETLSDECCSLMHTVEKYLTSSELNKDRINEISNYLDSVRVFFEQVCTYFALGVSDVQKVQGEIIEQKIDDTKKELKKASRKRIENNGDVKSELHYIDVIRKIEKAGDCVYSIIQSV